MGKRRPSGDGMVRKRDDGRWEGRIVVGHKANGDPIFRHVYAKTQKALTEKLHQSIECYQDVELTEDSRMTLGAVSYTHLDVYKRQRYALKMGSSVCVFVHCRNAPISRQRCSPYFTGRSQYSALTRPVCGNQRPQFLQRRTVTPRSTQLRSE